MSPTVSALARLSPLLPLVPNTSSAGRDRVLLYSGLDLNPGLSGLLRLVRVGGGLLSSCSLCKAGSGLVSCSSIFVGLVFGSVFCMGAWFVLWVLCFFVVVSQRQGVLGSVVGWEDGEG